MDGDHFRHQVRNNFMGHLKNSVLKHKHGQNTQPETLSQYYNDQTLKAERKIREFGVDVQSKHRNSNQYRLSGGDADRLLYYSSANPQYGNNYYRHCDNDNICSQRHLHTGNKTAQSLPSSVNTSRKHQTTQAEDYIGDHRCLYENDSNLGGVGNCSEDSAKSQKSSKTVVSCKSSHDLRRMVTSQCKLHDVIDETLKQMCKSEVEPKTDDNTCHLQEQPTTNCPLTLGHCRRCSDRIETVQSQKDVTTEIGTGDFLECRNTEKLSISVDDVVNSKVINPMIRKLQRMYLNNLKEEMSLMEDLEHLPHKVNEVYKAAIFKKKNE